MQNHSGAGVARRRAMGEAASVSPSAPDSALGIVLEPAVVTTVNPVQSTTYHLQPANSTITFGAQTNIKVFGGGVGAVVGANAHYTVTNNGNLSSNAYYGILLVSSGTVTNAGTITGRSGVVLRGGGDLVNTGVVAGQYGGGREAGVFMRTGSVENGAAGRISGDVGVYELSRLTLTNAGYIFGGTKGVVSKLGAAVDNEAGGVIAGFYAGLDLSGTRSSEVSVTNAGTIKSTASAGDYAVGVVVNSLFGSVDNLKGGQIQGGFGARMGAATTLTNAGVIQGSNTGVFAYGMARVANQEGGQISGDVGVHLIEATLVNAGTISGSVNSGVYMYESGVVSNGVTGAITGATYGVKLGVGYQYHGPAASVTNAGSIQGGAVGVDLDGPGSVANWAKATIAAPVAVEIAGAGKVINAGTIASTDDGVVTRGGAAVTNSGAISASVTSATSKGVVVGGGGTVTNQASGNISVGGAAVYSSVDAITVVNAGHLKAALGIGVDLTAGGSVTNASGGSIVGKLAGVQISGGSGTVVNAGTIKGGANGSVVFTGGGANSLALQTGSVLIAPAVGSTASGATNALVLEGSGEEVVRFFHFTSLNKQGAGTWTLGGASSIGAVAVSSGRLNVTGALTGSFNVGSGATLEGTALSLVGNIDDRGTVQFDQATDGVFAHRIFGTGALVKAGAGALVLSGAGAGFSGQVQIGSGVIELASAQAIGTGAVAFVAGSAAETLRIDAADAPAAGGFFGNVVSGFSGANDVIDLSNLAYVSGASVSLSGHALVLHDGGKGYGFHLAGAIGAGFTVASDGHGGTQITAAVASFAQAAASLMPSGPGLVTPPPGHGADGRVPLLGASARNG
jgi:autotransporter-associated beta strand protein